MVIKGDGQGLVWHPQKCKTRLKGQDRPGNGQGQVHRSDSMLEEGKKAGDKKRELGVGAEANRRTRGFIGTGVENW